MAHGTLLTSEAAVEASLMLLLALLGIQFEAIHLDPQEVSSLLLLYHPFVMI